MEYFKSGTQLISRIIGSSVYNIKNNIGLKVTSYTKEEFDNMPKKNLNKTQFFEEVNNYFRNYKETWDYEGERFRAMENFELNEKGEITNYEFDSLPKYYITLNGVSTQVIFIYNKGRVFYVDVSEENLSIVKMIDATTHEALTFVRLKNCCPVMNLTKRCKR